MHGKGIEPLPSLRRIRLKRIALDHSAIRALDLQVPFVLIFCTNLKIAVWNLTYYIIKMSLNIFYR